MPKTINHKRLTEANNAFYVAAFAVIALLGLFIPSSTKAHAQLATAEEKGLPMDSTFAGGDVDTVNLENGNIHISIPIYTDSSYLRQRG